MLVLSRKHNQQIRIGENVTITVLRVQGNTVRIGIDAPPSVRIIRGELPPLDVAVAVAEESDGEAEPEAAEGEAGVCESNSTPPRPLAAQVQAVVAAASAI